MEQTCNFQVESIILEIRTHGRVFSADNPLLFAGGCKFGQGHRVCSVSLVGTGIMLRILARTK